MPTEKTRLRPKKLVLIQEKEREREGDKKKTRITLKTELKHAVTPHLEILLFVIFHNLH